MGVNLIIKREREREKLRQLRKKEIFSPFRFYGFPFSHVQSTLILKEISFTAERKIAKQTHSKFV